MPGRARLLRRGRGPIFARRGGMPRSIPPMPPSTTRTELLRTHAIRASAFVAISAVLASCGSSTSDGPNGPPALTNTIVFVSDRTGDDELHIMHGNGDVVHLLTTVPGPKTDPVISPDGKKILFTLGTLDASSASPLWSVNSDGTGLTQLTTDGAIDYHPTWSPDGSQIAFVSTRDGNDEIYVMNADGTGQLNVTNNAANDNSPSWSPSGTTILFDSDRDGAAGIAIYSMTPAGGSVTPLIGGYNPEWSPSGTRFLFLRASQIWIAESAEASSVREVTADPFFHFTPGWSPDESKLLYATSTTSNEEIWTIASADGDNATQLTADADGNNFTPNWTRH
jgi:Tol biopolymer transport system component